MTRDFGAEAQKAAEAHLAACQEAMFAMEEDVETEVESPASAPFCGCDTCVVREVLYAAWTSWTSGSRTRSRGARAPRAPAGPIQRWRPPGPAGGGEAGEPGARAGAMASRDLHVERPDP